ncbi:MAG: DUF3291 domain-containing protein [Actinomycetota bacterium]|nr:DUF3291 domain-containing protein [Actinomycetota bacterium]
MGFQLAQVNIGRLVAPLDAPELAAFVEALDPINALADQAPGFVWRLQTDQGNATAVQAFEWDAGRSAGIIINMSVWVDVEHLSAFVYSPQHREYLRRRREFFQQMPQAYATCWWVPAGVRPGTDDAEQRILHVRRHGPTPFAFSMGQHFPPGLAVPAQE